VPCEPLAKRNDKKWGGATVQKGSGTRRGLASTYAGYGRKGGESRGALVTGRGTKAKNQLLTQKKSKGPFSAVGAK